MRNPNRIRDRRAARNTVRRNRVTHRKGEVAVSVVEQEVEEVSQEVTVVAQSVPANYTQEREEILARLDELEQTP